MAHAVSFALSRRLGAPVRFQVARILGRVALGGGLLALAAIVLAGVGCEKHEVSHEVDNTRIALAKAGRSLEQYRLEHNAIASAAQGQLLVAGLQDGWGRLLRYSVAAGGADYDVRSAGLDGLFDNADDIVLEKPTEQVTVPATAVTPALPTGETFHFSLTAEGAMTVAGRPVSTEQVTDELQQWSRSHAGGTVIIDYPNSTPSERILEAYTLCTQFKLVPTRAPLKLPATTLPAL